ncbi:hypothetical protein HDR67_01365, partial [bacterium]|nr:hypothetical protein [bacterium]
TEGNKTTYTFTIPADKVEEYKGNIGYDVYFDSVINGEETKDDYTSVFGKFE